MSKNDEPVVIRVGDAPTEEEVLCEKELSELIDEVQAEENYVPKQPFLKRVKYLFGIYPKKPNMVYKFQRLAGIINGETVGAVVLPNNQRIFFKQHPKWHEVMRYKLCGFKYETYV